MKAHVIGFAVTLGVVIGLAGALKRGAAAAEDRERNAFISAVDDLWLQALKDGANRHRWPDIQFAEDLGADLARTRCRPTRPIIDVNLKHLVEYSWAYRELVAPHELAHVMVCLDGDPTAWSDGHGEAWQNWVRRLVPADRAEEVLAEQAKFTEPTLSPVQFSTPPRSLP
jgi:hypothetical protein